MDRDDDVDVCIFSCKENCFPCLLSFYVLSRNRCGDIDDAVVDALKFHPKF